MHYNIFVFITQMFTLRIGIEPTTYNAGGRLYQLSYEASLFTNYAILLLFEQAHDRSKE